jgi:hypothetical protein
MILNSGARTWRGLHAHAFRSEDAMGKEERERRRKQRPEKKEK